MAETIFEKPLDHDVSVLSTNVTNLSNSIGTVPSGNTVEGQISALNNKITHLYVVSNTVSSLADLVVLVKTYENSDNIRANVDSSVVNALSNSTTSYDGVVDIIKVSNNNCYYHVFNNQVMAYGNLQLSTGNVNIINDLNSKLSVVTASHTFSNVGAGAGTWETVQLSVPSGKTLLTANVYQTSGLNLVPVWIKYVSSNAVDVMVWNGRTGATNVGVTVVGLCW